MKEFETLPELTDDQMKEINDCFTAYIFYEKIKVKEIGIAGETEIHEEYDCTCTACNTSYTHHFENFPKHNADVICPKCGTKATLKHKSYGKKCLHEEQRVILFCPEGENKVWMRAFYAFKSYNGDPYGNRMLNSLYNKSDENLTPDVELSETARYLLEPGSARFFKYQWSFYSSSYRCWNELANPQEPFTSYMGGGGDYWILSKSLLENTFMKYLDLDAYHKEARAFLGSNSLYYHRINPYTTRFIAAFAKYPIIESLIKAGYGEFVGELTINRAPHKRYCDWNAKGISDFFRGLSKTEVRTLHEEDYQVIFLLCYSEYKKLVKKPDIEVFRKDLKLFQYDDYKTLCQLVKKYKLNYTKAVNYLKKQNRKKPQDELQFWKDYLDFAKRLGYDLKNEVVLYPKQLHKAHDIATDLVNAMVREEQAKQMKELTAKLVKRYNFEYGDYMIVVPQSMQEIIDEGKKLSHCVGGYAERHASGKLAILFIRCKAAADTSFVTMEVHGKKIVQYHGFRNDVGKPLPNSVKEFVSEFTAYINDPTAYKKMKKAELSA